MLALIALIATLAPADPWAWQESGTKARLRGVSAHGVRVAWASGAGSTVIRTVDGGATWRGLAVPDSEGLDFRDVQALGDSAACLLAIGPGEKSRIYRTEDAGATWTLTHLNRDPKGFLDALAFWDLDHGLALGDPVDGRYAILTTDDGGRTWTKIPDAGMPPALPGEGAFAASGTCLAVQGTDLAWFGTGGGATARVFRSTDRGRTWAASATPIRVGNPSSGVFSVAFRDADHGLAAGGDYKAEGEPVGNLALTHDGGRTWAPAGGARPSGFRSAVAFAPGSGGMRVVAVGPSGSDLSTDGGMTWTKLGTAGFHALAFGDSVGWGVGEGGRVGKLDLKTPEKP